MPEPIDIRDLERAISSPISSKSLYLEHITMRKYNLIQTDSEGCGIAKKIYLLTGRLWFSDDSDEFFIIENLSSALNEATLPITDLILLQQYADIYRKCTTIHVQQHYLPDGNNIVCFNRSPFMNGERLSSSSGNK